MTVVEYLLLCSDDRLIYLNSVITVIPSTGVAAEWQDEHTLTWLSVNGTRTTGLVINTFADHSYSYCKLQHRQTVVVT